LLLHFGVSDVVDLFVICLTAVAALALVAKKLRIAYPVVLVLGGLLLGLFPHLPKIELDPEFIFLFFLPPLLYPAALFTPWRDFRANIRPILLLAIGLVLFTTAAVGYLAHHFMGLPLAAAFVLGAIISPPDAIAATAVARRLRIPSRIVAILEGESLVNDATALVAYRFAIAAVLTGSHSFSFTSATLQFVLIATGGVAIGVGIGWIAARFHSHVDDPPIEITVSFLTPFVAYNLAERLHASGVMSVVAAGLYLGWRTPQITNPRTRLLGGPFWEMIEFILNGFVFILIGVKLPAAVRALAGQSLSQLIGYALLISLAVIVIRIAWVFPATYLPRVLFPKLRARDPSPPWQSVTLVAWTGMRGVVSLASALSIPLALSDGSAFPGRDLILFLTFVVILATLVVQGISLPFLIRALGIKDDRSTEREEHQARLRANRAALDRLNQIDESGFAKTEARDRLRAEYEDRIRQLESFDPGDTRGRWNTFSTEYENLSLDTLTVERKIIIQLRNDSVINDEVLRRIQHDLDLAEARIKGAD
jgi:CPA1 family monovalent cation:H+ antiporter